VGVMSKKAWSPGQGPPVAPQQVPGLRGKVAGDGEDERAPRSGGAPSDTALWAPSEGPARSDPGGPGGEPDGRTLQRQGSNALNEK
jgi:hypothetical protein